MNPDSIYERDDHFGIAILNPDEPKRVGCCTDCGTEVFEVKHRYPEGPLHKFPRTLGGPLENAIRITYLLGDGTQASLTSCADCLGAMLDPVNFPALWHKVLNTFVFEERDDVRAALPSAPMTAEQKRMNEGFILQQTTNHIVGVLGHIPWTEVDV